MRKGAFVFSLIFTAAGFAALIAAPAAARSGVQAGLSVCIESIIPALFPFLVLSGLLTSLGLPALLARYIAPAMRLFFAAPGSVAAALLLGLTGGYPLGAASLAALAEHGEINREDGSRLLPLCNNTGPAFIIGAAGSSIFGSAKTGLLLYFSHILAAIAVGAIFSVGHRAAASVCTPVPICTLHFSKALIGAVRRALAALGNICAFVLLFSTLRALLDELGISSALTGVLIDRLAAPPQFARALLAGFLELGGGIAAMHGMAVTPQNLALCSFLLGFGSLSVHCQTLAAVAGAQLKTARHFVGRLLHGAISAGITFLLFTLLRI